MAREMDFALREAIGVGRRRKTVELVSFFVDERHVLARIAIGDEVGYKEVTPQALRVFTRSENCPRNVALTTEGVTAPVEMKVSTTH